jgi:GT2 family glycosyltransferase
MLTSILILFCNKSNVTRRCLPSLLNTTHRPLQFVLVDNGSTDDTPELLDAFESDCARDGEATVRRLRFNENVGAVAGRNAAFGELEGDAVAFLDNDVRVRRRDWLTRMIAVLDADPGVGLVAGKLRYPFAPHLIQSAGCDVSPTGRVDFRGRGLPGDLPEFNASCDVQAAISACWLVRRSVIREVGDLDMRFHPVQFEDIDYCYRIRQAGWRCRYEPLAEMYHFENTTTEGEVAPKRYIRLTLEQGKKFKEKWQAVFSKENGKPDGDMVWRDVPREPLDAIPDPPML